LIEMTASERSRNRFSANTLQLALETFRSCGVIVLPSVVGADAVQSFWEGIQGRLQLHLASRNRVRDHLKRGALQGMTLGQMWQNPDWRLPDELIFSNGHTVRERNDGRIDIQSPFASPYNDSAFIFNPFIYPILAGLLGEHVRLKQINTMIALPKDKEGDGVQHWHRDTDLLFADDRAFHDRDVHQRDHGIHLPPYAINVFVSLINLTMQNGPTEFTLASHQWGSVWKDDEEAGGIVDKRFYVPAGSAIIADYRTVHRGTSNYSGKIRPVAMMIYGRDWWFDTVNYGSSDYGGYGTHGWFGAGAVLDPFSPAGRHHNLVSQIVGDEKRCDIERQIREHRIPLSQREEMFHFLSDLWKETLRKEISRKT